MSSSFQGIGYWFLRSLTNLMLEGCQRFNRKNYNTWKQHMLTIFEYRCLEALVQGTETRPTTIDATQDKFDERNREAGMLIKLSVTNDQLPQIPSSKTTTKIWTILKDLHETSDKSRSSFLKNQLFSIIMDENMCLQEHLLKIKDIKDQLEAIGRIMEQEDMVVITLRNLPPSYEHFIEMLNITATNLNLKFSDLCTKLLQQDHWKQQFGSSAPLSSSEQAFLAQSFHKDKGPSHSSAPSEDSSRKNIRCNYGHKFGHMLRDCRAHIVSDQWKQGRTQPQANVSEHVDLSDQPEAAFYAF